MTRTVIIGGGVIGLSVAYHLSGRDAGEVILLERNQLTSGTSWHAAGIVGPLRAKPNMTRLASHALDLFPALERETGLSTGYRCTGGYWLARETARLDELRRIADLGLTQGLTCRMVSTADIPVPQLDLTSHVGALHVPEDGSVNPVDLCMAYAKAARSKGVDIREGETVKRLRTDGTRATGVILADGRAIAADRVVLCAGAWSRALAETADVPLPLQAVEHMYVVTQPFEGIAEPFPVIRDLDTGIYVKGDAGKLVIGGFEPDARCWDPHGPEGDRPFLELAEDWNQFAPFMQAALDLVPALDKVGIQHFMNGPESFTSDTRPLIGQAPQVDGLWVAAGMNSVGVMSSAGIGRLLADWVLEGAPSMDAWEVDVARVDPMTATPAHMRERMKEAVSDLFALHWPYKQPRAGRGLRRSALHERWARSGAVFGLTGGWERGLWYARNEAEKTLPYSVAAQPWWPIAAREAAVMDEGAALLDLSPFTKIDLAGSGVAAALDRLSTASIEIAPGRTVYTQLLNRRGGIEMDVTIARLGETHFHIVSGAATRQRDLAYLRRHLTGDVAIADLTEEYSTIGVMGAGSRRILENVADWLPELAFGDVANATLARRPGRLTRISFAGEYGYEVMVANADAEMVFDALHAAGAQPMGHYGLDGCRMEKGYRHWGHDIGPDVTPLEAGLGFTIDWSRDFIGRDALAAQRRAGVSRRLVLFRIEGDALMLHDEPIHAAGRPVGLTSSGARGPRTGLNLSFGMVDVAPGETLQDTCARAFTIRVAGVDHVAVPLCRAPFDPDGRRMRP